MICSVSKFVARWALEIEKGNIEKAIEYTMKNQAILELEEKS